MLTPFSSRNFVLKIAQIMNIFNFSKISPGEEACKSHFTKERKKQGVHTAICNFRKILLGIHHGVKSEYLQNYLNEFCYKFNRRYFNPNIFDRLIIASIT
jgi:hypothetical protein